MTNSTTTQGSTAESGTVHPVHYSRRQMLRNLPSELKSRILDFLDFEGISSIRLTSRGFAVIGASQLWANGLILRPYRNHMQRLTEVCSCPRIVQLIDKLTISLDDTDQESIKQTLSLWSECNSFAYGPDSEYNRFSFQPSDSNPTYCDTQLLARALQSLHNVKYLHIESGEYPFVKRNLLQHWDQMHKLNRTVSGALSTFQNLKPATKYYRSILMAVNATTLSLTTLRLNCMPSECFVNPGKEHANSPPNYLSAMSAAVSKVHDAQICFSGWAMDRYTPTENETIVRNIVSFLSSMPLRTLDCQWDWNCGRMIWHAFLFRTVFALHLPFLESLQLQTLPLQYYTVTPGGQLPTTLAVFLSRHASTLRRVYFDSTMLLTQGLYHCLEARCAWKGNLDIIKATMKLEKFEFIIDQGDGERIYNPDWTPISGGKECDAKDLENYVLGKDVWKPMWGHDDTKCPLQGGPDWTQGL